MRWVGQYTVDPSEMASRFCEADGMAYMDSIFEEPSEDDQLRIDRVREIMRMLPIMEADFVELYYFRKWKQTDIAELFQVRQPTVHYRLKKAADRIRFYLNLPTIDHDEIERVFASALQDELNVRIMLLMLETTCQTRVASILGISQGKVRHRFYAVLDIMRAGGFPDCDPYLPLFEYVARNPKILHEVHKSPEDTKPTFILA